MGFLVLMSLKMVKVIINGVEYTGNNVTVCDGDVIVELIKWQSQI